VHATSPRGPWLETTALTASLGLAAVLAAAPRAWAAAPSPGAFLTAAAVALLLSRLAVLRAILRAAPSRLRRTAWAAAGALGGAALLRHGLDALHIAAGELPLSAVVLGPLVLGEFSVILLVAGLVLGGALLGRRWLTAAALVSVFLALSPLSTMPPAAPKSFAPGGWLAATAWFSAVSWVAALPRPVRGPIAGLARHGTAAACWLLLSAALVGGGGAPLDDGALLAQAGRRAFGLYGREVAASFEVAACAVAAAAVMLLSTASIDRGPAFVIAVGAFALVLMSGAQLLVAAGIAGWVAVVLGPVPGRV